MTAGRRPLVIALAAALLVIVGLLIALIAAGGNSGNDRTPDRATPTNQRPARRRPRGDRADRRSPTSKALDPKSPDDPCRYMTPEAADDVMVFADREFGRRRRRVKRAPSRAPAASLPGRCGR